MAFGTLLLGIDKLSVARYREVVYGYQCDGIDDAKYKIYERPSKPRT